MRQWCFWITPSWQAVMDIFGSHPLGKLSVTLFGSDPLGKLSVTLLDHALLASCQWHFWIAPSWQATSSVQCFKINVLRHWCVHIVWVKKICRDSNWWQTPMVKLYVYMITDNFFVSVSVLSELSVVGWSEAWKVYPFELYPPDNPQAQPAEGRPRTSMTNCSYRFANCKFLHRLNLSNLILPQEKHINCDKFVLS